MKGVLGILAALFLCITMALPVGATQAYFNDFEGNPATWTEWSLPQQATTPVGARNFLGIFSNDANTLTLTGLPGHTDATVSFDLFILRSWDGNSFNYGPDYWQMSAGATSLLQTTFSNGFGDEQSFPGNYYTYNIPRTGAVENDTLGYGDGSWGDSVYRLSFTFPHTASSLGLNFEGYNLQGWSDEGWGLDNVKVELSGVSAPLPSAVLLLGSSLLGLAGWRRIKRS